MKIRRKLDEYGMLVPNELELKFYGGGGGKGGAGVVDRHPFPQPAAVATPAPAAPVTEAVTQDTAATPEEEAKKLKEANKSGAKSLQIPLTSRSTTSDATKAVGTI